MHTEIKRWGNSAAIRLSSKLLAATRLEISSLISIEVEGNRIIIQALPEETGRRLSLPYSEEDLLAGLTPETAHADALAELSAVETGD